VRRLLRVAVASGLGCALALGLALAARPAHAEKAELVLDGLSFIAFEGSKAAVLLPAGSVIPATIEPSGASSWTVTIEPAALEVPPVAYPSGRSIQWRLSAPAKGTITRDGETLRCTLEAPLMAKRDDAPGEVAFPLTFTTETSTATAKGLTASREGVRLDPASGYLQLVATGVNPVHAETAPGEPFVAVLSGVLRGLPASLSKR
jgi:hypothetical protein